VKIALQLLASAVFSVIFFGLLLFWPAGTFDYWQAWVFIAVFVGMGLSGIRCTSAM
jgi:hypothetical protein